jgi:hypothetical protein
MMHTWFAHHCMDTDLRCGCGQLGSTTLGRVNDEDAEKGVVWWDVFKAAKLDGLREKRLDEEALKPKNSKRLRVEHTINIAAKMPRTFQGHSPKELKMIAYVQVGGGACCRAAFCCCIDESLAAHTRMLPMLRLRYVSAFVSRHASHCGRWHMHLTWQRPLLRPLSKPTYDRNHV